MVFKDRFRGAYDKAIVLTADRMVGISGRLSGANKQKPEPDNPNINSDARSIRISYIKALLKGLGSLFSPSLPVASDSGPRSYTGGYESPVNRKVNKN